MAELMMMPAVYVEHVDWLIKAPVTVCAWFVDDLCATAALLMEAAQPLSQAETQAVLEVTGPDALRERLAGDPAARTWVREHFRDWVGSSPALRR